MRIVLNSSLERVQRDYPRDGTRHAEELRRKIIPDYRKQDKLEYLGSEFYPDIERLHLGYLDIMAHSYSNHEKLRVAPHDLWFIVLTELAKIVNANSARYRDLFTTSSEKTEISIPTGDPTEIDPAELFARLITLVPTDTEAFIPHLSTMDQDTALAFYATFCDMVKSYYSYSTFCCGIPEIEVTGTIEDWQRIMLSLSKLGVIFLDKDPAVVEYLIRVGDVFAEIGRQVGDNDPDVGFWKDIFRSQNVGSGGELLINGWITKLFFKIHEVPKLDNFLSTFGVIPYTNLDTHRKFKAVHGTFSHRRDENGFIYASYDKIIFEDHNTD